MPVIHRLSAGRRAPSDAMQKKLIILANNESLRAYNLTRDDLATPTTRIEPSDVDLHPRQPDPTGASDDDGCFPGGSSVGQTVAMKHGEPHGRKTEKKKRFIRDLAKTISELINREECDIWNLAMPANQAQQLIDELPIDVQKKLTQLKEGDYTWLPASEVQELFAH